MYVETHVNGKPTKTMVDTSATYNFVSMDEVKRLKFHASKKGGRLKVVNSTTKPLQGVAREMTINIYYQA